MYFAPANSYISLRIRVTFRQCFGEFCIVAIYIVVKVDLTVLVGNGSPVNDKNRNATCQTHGGIVPAVLHSLLHALNGPAGIVAQHPCCKVGRPFDANAPGTKIWLREKSSVAGVLCR